MREPTFCIVGDCERQSRRPLCEVHGKRAQRGKPLLGEVQQQLDARAWLIEAAIRLADADAEDDVRYLGCEKSLCVAAVRYARWIDRQRAEAGEASAGAPS